ncbi:MAG TPA: hypothetical protein VIH35_03990, partial [Kiritimatiellia bacterium]
MKARTVPTLLGAIAMAACTSAALADVNLLQNPDFENLNPGDTADYTNPVFSVAWSKVPGHSAYHEPWAWYSMTNGGVFQGWNTATNPGGIQQSVAAGPGTYTFEMWLKFESGANPTNATLRMEWLDSSSNVLQAAAITNVTAMARDNQFHKRYVTGTCTSNNLAYVRVSYICSYDTGGAGGQAITFDDASMYPGPFYRGGMLRNNSLEEGQSFSIDGSRWVRTSGSANHRPNWATRSGGEG